MKALVTGANGLIGSNLVNELTSNGFQVKSFVRNGSNLESLSGINTEFCYGDILNYDSLLKAAEGCDIIFHTAALYTYSKYSPEQILNTGIEGTRNVMNAANAAGINTVVLTSSSAVLGSGTKYEVRDEDSSVDNSEYISPYVEAKIEQEKTGFELADKLGIKLISVLPAVTVGGRDYRLSESNSIIVNYLNDPFKASWIGGCNIVSVKDVAKGHLIAALKGESNQRYILGSENLLWSDVHKIISELCGLPGPLMTANHTSSYIAASVYEAISLFSKKEPPTTRIQAKMVGRYFWYSSDRIRALGYNPVSSREALVDSVSWLITSNHISNSLRSQIHPADEVYKYRLNHKFY